MESFKQVIGIQSVLLVYMAVGFLCRKIRLVNDEMRARLTDFVLFVTLPCMVFNSFNIAFSREILAQSALAILIAAVIAVATLLMGPPLYRAQAPERQKVLRFGTLVNNAVFGGIPIVSGLYGAEGVMLSSFFVIPQRILMWTVGVSIFTAEKGKAGKAILMVLKMPTVVAVYLGILRMVLQLPLPGFLDTAIKNMGSCTSPLATVLVGSILADTKPSALLDAAAFTMALVRQILVPLATLLGLRLLGIGGVMGGVSVILTAMPAGTTTAILAKKYGADAELACTSIFISTILSLFTVPLFLSFL